MQLSSDDVLEAWVMQILYDLHLKGIPEASTQQIANELIVRHPEYKNLFQGIMSAHGITIRLQGKGFIEVRYETSDHVRERGSNKGKAVRFVRLTSKAHDHSPDWQNVLPDAQLF